MLLPHTLRRSIRFALGATLALAASLICLYLLIATPLASTSRAQASPNLAGDDGEQTVFTYDDGLPSNSVTALLRDRTSLWVGTLAGLSCYTLHGRDAGLLWQTFGRADGMAADAVSDLWTDDAERLWVAHPEGQISVLDGSAWTTYANLTQTLELAYDQIIDDNVNSPLWAVERGGRVWTLDEGTVGYYVGAVWRPYGEDAGIPRGQLVAVWTGDNGAWVASESGQIGYFDGTGWTTFRNIYDAVQAQYEIIAALGPSVGPLWLVDGEGAVWVRNAFNQFNTLPDVRRFVEGRWSGFSSAEGMSSGFAAELRLDEQGRIWARHLADANGQGGGLSLFDGERWLAITPTPSGNVTAFWPEETDGVWIGSFFQPAGGGAPVGGLTYVALNTWQRFSLAGLRGTAVADTWLDENDTLWMGLAGDAQNRGGGLFRYSPPQGTAPAQWTQRTGLLNDSVRDLWGDGQGYLWVTTAGGVHHLSLRGRTTFTHTLHTNPDQVSGDAQGNVWALAWGQEEGVWQWDGSVWASHTVSEGLSGGPYSDMLVLPDGRVYLAGDRGLDTWEGEAWETFAALPGLHIRQVWQDAAGDLWLSSEITPGRPFNLSLNRGRAWETVLDETGSRSMGPEPLAFLRDSQGRAWMGTSLGLFVYEPDGDARWRGLGPVDGLPAGPVPTLYQDAGGTVWLAVGEQVYRSDGWDWRRFEPQVGVVSRIAAGPEGSVFFAGDIRVALYQQRRPELRLDGVVNLITGERVDGREPVVLTVGRNAMRVELSAIAPALASDELSYRYRLQGFDDWRVLPARALGGKQASITYAGLPGGVYAFTAAARTDALDYGPELSFALYVLSRPPELFLDQATVAGRPVEQPGALRAYVEQPLQFQLSSGDDQGGALTYRYQIQGLGQGWTETTRSEISFTLSAAGTFTFVALALDDEGQASLPVGAQITVSTRETVERTGALPVQALAGGLLLLALLFIGAAIRLIVKRRQRESW
jgi:hypothetical protein